MSKRVILITGSSSGIGYETALLFARTGDAVYATMRDIRSDGGQKLAKIATSENLTLYTRTLDVTHQSDVDAVVAEIVSKEGRIDLLINNAGFGFIGPVELATIDEIKHQYETNIFGVLRMIKAVVPHMRERTAGRIINISSINGLVSFPLYGVYSSSKFALETLSESLRHELSAWNILVSCVEPGSFRTGFTTNKKNPARMSSCDSVYKPVTDRFFAALDGALKKSQNKFIANATHPTRVAKRIYKISNQKRPKLHNVIGVDAHILRFLKRFMPERVWEWGVRRVYGFEDLVT